MYDSVLSGVLCCEDREGLCLVNSRTAGAAVAGMAIILDLVTQPLMGGQTNTVHITHARHLANHRDKNMT